RLGQVSHRAPNQFHELDRAPRPSSSTLNAILRAATRIFVSDRRKCHAEARGSRSQRINPLLMLRLCLSFLPGSVFPRERVLASRQDWLHQSAKNGTGTRKACCSRMLAGPRKEVYCVKNRTRM